MCVDEIGRASERENYAIYKLSNEHRLWPLISPRCEHSALLCVDGRVRKSNDEGKCERRPKSASARRMKNQHTALQRI